MKATKVQIGSGRCGDDETMVESRLVSAIGRCGVVTDIMTRWVIGANDVNAFRENANSRDMEVLKNRGDHYSILSHCIILGQSASWIYWLSHEPLF